MPRSRKQTDPRIVALLDQAAREHERGERWYRRLKRALAGLEKARQAVRRLERRLARLQAEAEAK